MLAQFAEAYGYDLRYYLPGEEDRRVEFAENLQVDVISGCVEGERFDNIVGEPAALPVAVYPRGARGAAGRPEGLCPRSDATGRDAGTKRRRAQGKQPGVLAGGGHVGRSGMPVVCLPGARCAAL